MQIRNKKTPFINNGDMAGRFEQFKRQILSSGQSPEKILSDLLSSGKVSQETLQRIITMAKNSHLK